MDGDTDIHSLPLLSLPTKTRNLLSSLLNTPKIIPSDNRDRLLRDWRGLASLVGISAELVSNIYQYEDRTSKVLDIWQRRDSTATVGDLLQFLERLDRFDVYDDLCKDLREFINTQGNVAVRLQYDNLPHINHNNSVVANGDAELITYDDRPGYKHQYHAFVLYAKNDQVFVDELLKRLGDDGFELCTVDKLQAGHITQYGPVSRLISERCQRIIIIFSPDFLQSPANTFYGNYAQAVSIESSRKIIPIMYRECQLPVNLAYYHRLHYPSEGRAMYDFWNKLKQSLELVRSPQPQYRLNGATSSQSMLQITEMKSNPKQFSSDFIDTRLFLPPAPRHNVSMNDLDKLAVSDVATDECKSLGGLSQVSDVSGKKQSTLSKIWNTIRKKKSGKKAFMVAD